MKLNTKYILIGLLIFVIIIAIIFISTSDPSKCDKGTYKKEGCIGCVPDCINGFSSDGLCSCECVDPSYDNDNPDPDKPTTIIWQDGAPVPADKEFDLSKVECLFQKYCSINEELRGLQYNESTGKCDICSDGVEACTKDGTDLKFCCTNKGSTCTNASECCPPTRTYIDTRTNKETCCGAGTVTKDWKPGDDYCQGTSDQCCFEFCGTSGHDEPGFGGGDWCDSGESCNTSGAGTLETVQKEIDETNKDENSRVVDGPSKCQISSDGNFDYEFAYCSSKNANAKKESPCTPIIVGGPGIVTELPAVNLPETENTYYNLNLNESKIVIPIDMLKPTTTFIKPNEDYSASLKDAASFNGDGRSTLDTTRFVLKPLSTIFNFVVFTQNESFSNFIFNYVKGTVPTGTGGSKYGFYAGILPETTDSSWGRIAGFTTNTLTDCTSKVNEQNKANEQNHVVFTDPSEMNDIDAHNCMGFYYVNKDSQFNPVTDTDISNLLATCKKYITDSTGTVNIDTLTGEEYFQTSSGGGTLRCVFDGQLNIVVGAQKKYISTSQLRTDQIVPKGYCAQDNLTVGVQHADSVDERFIGLTQPPASGLLVNSGGPMCIGFTKDTAEKLIGFNDLKPTLYDSQSSCEAQHPCYGGFQRNTKDGACNVDSCTDDGYAPKTELTNVTWSSAPVQTKKWTHGKDGCYRTTVPDDEKLILGSCKSDKWPFSRTCGGGYTLNDIYRYNADGSDTRTKANDYVTGRDGDWKIRCNANGTLECNGQLIDDYMTKFNPSPSSQFKWCVAQPPPQDCSTICVPGQGCNYTCVNTGPASYAFKDLTSLPSGGSLTRDADEYKKNFNCHPKDIPK